LPENGAKVVVWDDFFVLHWTEGEWDGEGELGDRWSGLFVWGLKK
jgi:hypothetical protein